MEATSQFEAFLGCGKWADNSIADCGLRLEGTWPYAEGDIWCADGEGGYEPGI